MIVTIKTLFFYSRRKDKNKKKKNFLENLFKTYFINYFFIKI